MPDPAASPDVPETDLGGTESLCPHCLRLLAARRIRRGDAVFLRKDCPVHGRSETVIWRGEPEFESWRRAKTPSPAPAGAKPGERGCPLDCGLCLEHGQRTCTALIEVTQRCNLGCAVCYASSGENSCPEPTRRDIERLYDTARTLGGECNVQLSGGEPTMRPDLPEIVALGRSKGFAFIQVNSNGLRLAESPELVRELVQAGLSSIFLQFDGVDDGPYLALRGRALAQVKRRAVANCLAAGLGVILVPVIVPGVNDGQLGDIVKFALEAGPGVRGVHFQPVSHFGRAHIPAQARITLPEIMRGLEAQTGGLVRVAHFRPPGCEHSLCSFNASYVRGPGGTLNLKGRDGREACCSPARPAHAGAVQAIAKTARQWSPPDDPDAAAVAPSPGRLPSLDDFLRVAPSLSFTVSGMAFQDAWTLDLERLRGCCIHVVEPDRLIPFCAYNLTASQGQTLYRNRSEAACPPL